MDLLKTSLKIATGIVINGSVSIGLVFFVTAKR
jgi:hypothetical protein